MISTLWAVILTGLFAVGGTVLGVAITARTQSKAQERAWAREDRERRQLVYEDFGFACRSGQEYLTQLISPREWKIYRAELIVRQEAIVKTGMRLNIVASDPVKNAADNLSKATLAVIVRLTELHTSKASKPLGTFQVIDLEDAQLAELRAETDEALQSFLRAIRAD